MKGVGLRDIAPIYSHLDSTLDNWNVVDAVSLLTDETGFLFIFYFVTHCFNFRVELL